MSNYVARTLKRVYSPSTDRSVQQIWTWMDLKGPKGAAAYNWPWYVLSLWSDHWTWLLLTVFKLFCGLGNLAPTSVSVRCIEQWSRAGVDYENCICLDWKPQEQCSWAPEVHCTAAQVRSVQCTGNSMQCTVYIVQCTLHNRWGVYSAQVSTAQCTGEELITGQTGNIRLGWRLLQPGPASALLCYTLVEIYY